MSKLMVCPGLYSMVSFAAVLVKDGELDCSFYGKTKPMSEQFIRSALQVCHTTREQHLTYDDPKEVMTRFAQWLSEHNKGRPVFLSDNPAFDWQFIHYYFIAHHRVQPLRTQHPTILVTFTQVWNMIFTSKQMEISERSYEAYPSSRG